MLYLSIEIFFSIQMQLSRVKNSPGMTEQGLNIDPQQKITKSVLFPMPAERGRLTTHD